MRPSRVKVSIPARSEKQIERKVSELVKAQRNGRWAYGVIPRLPMGMSDSSSLQFLIVHQLVKILCCFCSVFIVSLFHSTKNLGAPVAVIDAGTLGSRWRAISLVRHMMVWHDL